MTAGQRKALKRIFAKAAALRPPERGAYLAKACHGDEALLREVESLLAHDDRRKGFLGLYTSAAGKQVGPYELLEQIGGGMSHVFKAWDTRLNRLAALKFLPVWAVGSASWRQRLLHEARCAAALSHPNIVTIYEIAQEEGVDFIAMEYLAGHTMKDLIPSRGLSAELALKYAIQIAEALAKAHDSGILHRDLKPSNIMVTHGEVKLLDFGLAVSVGRETIMPDAFGTAAYSAPEVLQGEMPEPRSDLFSFGLVLFEMLSGRHAFGHGTRDEMIRAIVHEPCRKLPAKVPAELGKAVVRCLAKDREQRFTSMREVLLALTSCEKMVNPHAPGAQPIDDASPVEARIDLRSPHASQIRAAIRRLRYDSVAKSRAAVAEIESLLQGGASAPLRELVTSVGRDMILTLPVFEGNAVPDPVREVRKMALELLKLSTEGNLRSCFKEEDLELLDLYEMNFSSLKLPGFSFRRCFLVESTFQESDLSRATFAGAWIRNVSFEGADLSEVNFSDADWFNSLGLTEHQLRSVRRSTLIDCPATVKEMQGHLEARYGFPFESWSARVQEQLKGAWQEYLKPGGLRDKSAGWKADTR